MTEEGLCNQYKWYAAHLAYVRGDSTGVRANLSGADLREADLREANLRWADLRGANLSGANLSGADLRWADLRGANLSGANLSGADLRGANLRGANLREADLREADLRGANLRGANLREADLREADLREADLRGADLREANAFHRLTHAEHGHTVDAVWHADRWRVKAGCRDFTVAEARQHWGADDYPRPVTGSKILAMLDWLEKQETPADRAGEGSEG